MSVADGVPNVRTDKIAGFSASTDLGWHNRHAEDGMEAFWDVEHPGRLLDRCTSQTLGRARPEGQNSGGRNPDQLVAAGKYKALEIRLREVERENELLNYPDVRIMPMFP